MLVVILANTYVAIVITIWYDALKMTNKTYAVHIDDVRAMKIMTAPSANDTLPIRNSPRIFQFALGRMRRNAMIAPV